MSLPRERFNPLENQAYKNVNSEGAWKCDFIGREGGGGGGQFFKYRAPIKSLRMHQTISIGL